MKSVAIETEYITLGQFLKMVNLIHSGGEAKLFIATNEIVVDGEIETRRGRKLREGSRVTVGNQDYVVIRS